MVVLLLPLLQRAQPQRMLQLGGRELRIAVGQMEVSAAGQRIFEKGCVA